MQKRNVVALYRLLTNGEELVQAGMVMVNMLLIKGIHPDNIILNTNSLGGGIAAEVLKRFEDQGIHCTLIHSNSYSSLKNAVAGSPHGLVRWLPSMLLNSWVKHCNLDFNPQEIIENTKCPVLIVGRKEDTVIPEELQLVGKLDDQFTKKRLRRNIVLEHDPAITCKSKNIHTDHEEHLIYHQDGGNATKYEEGKKQFIEEAHEHLTTQKLNDGFDRKRYTESSFSRNLTGIELEPINK